MKNLFFLISFFLVCIGIVTANAEPIQIGSSKTYWELNNEVLTISGHYSNEDYVYGMPDFPHQTLQPWAANRNSINTVVIKNGVGAIGACAFAGFKNLTSVIFESDNRVYHISSDAFYNCAALKSFTIPENLSSISGSAFRDCDVLTDIIVESASFCFEDGVLYDKDKTTLELYLSNNMRNSFTIPKTVTDINSRAFYGCDKLNVITFEKESLLQRIGLTQL